jgi:holliday junction DNA helicase RuvA
MSVRSMFGSSGSVRDSMIAKVTGLLAEVGEDRVLIDRDGLGYEILVPGYMVAQLSDRVGQPVTLFTMDYLEGSATSGNLVPRLAGFASPAEKAAFQQILNVKGFGVRKALKALAAPIAQVAAAIEQGDTASLSRLPGVGKRTAEQIVATLRGKLTEFALQDRLLSSVDGQAGRAQSPLSQAQLDALHVMLAWGDRRLDAEQYLRRAAETHKDLKSPEDWVRAAYKIKAGGL